MMTFALALWLKVALKLVVTVVFSIGGIIIASFVGCFAGSADPNTGRADNKLFYIVLGIALALIAVIWVFV